MRNKNTILILGIISLLLVLGVGYAVVSNVTVYFDGTATANSELNAEITNVQAASSISGKVIDFTHATGTDNLSDEFTINGIELNEIVTITYTIRNNETDVDAILTNLSNITNSNTTYFDVSYAITDSYTRVNCSDSIMKCTITVKLKKTPVLESNSISTIGINFKAEATELRSCKQYS